MLNKLPLAWRIHRLANQIARAVHRTGSGKPRDVFNSFVAHRRIDFLREPKMKGLRALQVPGFKNPVWVRAGTSDLDVAMQLFVEDEIRFSAISGARWIIDLGANIGISSLLFARRFPDANVLAVEVDRENFALLSMNCAAFENIIPINKAVWSDTGYVRISNPEAQPWSFRVEPTGTDNPNGYRAICLDDLLAEFSIERLDILKMDVEGAEASILSSPSRGWFFKTSLFAVELHERHVPGCESAFRNLVSTRPHRLEACGEYRIARFLDLVGAHDAPSAVAHTAP